MVNAAIAVRSILWNELGRLIAVFEKGRVGTALRGDDGFETRWQDYEVVGPEGDFVAIVAQDSGRTTYKLYDECRSMESSWGYRQ